jgi:hypothetical protein
VRESYLLIGVPTGNSEPVWPKYSSGAGIILKQAAEALAAMDISATRFQRRGREEERISLSLSRRWFTRPVMYANSRAPIVVSHYESTW